MMWTTSRLQQALETATIVHVCLRMQEYATVLLAILKVNNSKNTSIFCEESDRRSNKLRYSIV